MVLQQFAGERRIGRYPGSTAIGQNIDGAIRPDANLPNTGVQIRQQRFFGDHLVVLDREPVQNHATEAADEDTTPPLWKQGAGIKSKTGGRDHRIPVIHWLLQSFLMGDAIADRGARVVDTTDDYWPSVILALLDDVQLISAARAMFVLPQASGCRIKCQAFLAAHAVGPDLRQDVRFAEERIVRCRCAIGRDVNDLAQMVVQSLRDVPGR